MAEVIKTYYERGGTDDRSGELSQEEYLAQDEGKTLEETMWNNVKSSASDDSDQQIFVNGKEYSYYDCFDEPDEPGEEKTLEEFKKEYGIDQITSMSYLDTPWNSMCSDTIHLEIVQEEPTDLELWHVGWGEFDGWESDLYSGSEVFTSKAAAVKWLKKDYKQRMEDFFGQDPDSDVKTELELDAGDFDTIYTVKTPDCENRYAKWTINRTVFKDFFKKKS